MFYMLRRKSTGRFVGTTYSSDDGVDCCELCDDSSALWVSESKDVAMSVCKTDTPWYNSDHETPINPYVGDLEVVEVGLTGA